MYLHPEDIKAEEPRAKSIEVDVKTETQSGPVKSTTATCSSQRTLIDAKKGVPKEYIAAKVVVKDKVVRPAVKDTGDVSSADASINGEISQEYLNDASIPSLSTSKGTTVSTPVIPLAAVDSTKEGSIVQDEKTDTVEQIVELGAGVTEGNAIHTLASNDVENVKSEEITNSSSTRSTEGITPVPSVPSTVAISITNAPLTPEASSSIVTPDSIIQPTPTVIEIPTSAVKQPSSSYTIPSASTPPVATATPPEPEPTLDPCSSQVKSLKERFNYASFDCGALILSVSPGSSSASSILIGKKDEYMLSRCISPRSTAGSPLRFVTIELCDNILIDVLALANFEYFSSNFKEFRVLVSERYPPKDNWKELGTFLAANVRGIQYFSVKQPLIFARYMRIEFLSQYGNEFYCPLTLVRVYGTTEMEAFKAEEEELAKMNAAEEAEAIAALTAVTKESVGNLGDFVWPSAEFIHVHKPKRLYSEIGVGPSGGLEADEKIVEIQNVLGDVIPDSGKEMGDTSNGRSASYRSTWVLSPDYFREFMASEPFPADAGVSIAQTPSFPIAVGVQHPDPSSEQTTTPLASGSPSSSVEKALPSLATTATSTFPSASLPPNPGSQPSGNPTSGSSINQQASASTTQESIFKTISKRLSLLERNASLSYKYIEETSKAYHEAFKRMEVSRAETLRFALMECNRTTVKMVRELVRDYDSSWRVLIRDIERDRVHTESKLNNFASVLERIEEQMKRHLYTEIFLIATIIFLASRMIVQSVTSPRVDPPRPSVSSPNTREQTRFQSDLPVKMVTSVATLQ
ncbi:UNC-like C-terminal-domain-containing protein [Chytridium lagenaria]|nr:UNC-like C-terminal-domain-containing protein [Chytridium lagenaria]